ncbi:MAG: TonB-dependent receptor [Acidobacteriota bacterium]
MFTALLLCCSLQALAQTPGTGALAGTVFDSNHRALPHATVQVVSVETQIPHAAETNADGNFRVPFLPPGTYDVTVTGTGFAANTTHAVRIVVSETASLNVTLAIAGVKQTVDVSANASLTDVESSTLGGLVDGHAIQSLPLASRNYTQTLGLAPGVVVDLPVASALGNGTQNVASNGATPTSNNLQFNGVDANNLVENSAASAQNFQVGTAIPAPDAIEEFKIQTANFDAAYGRGSGANVDLVTRSGTENVHGSAWEFVRNNIFNANDFFSKNSGQPRAELKQNQFGAGIGGPLFHNRTFYFGSYQGTRQVNGLGDSKTTTLPLLTSNRSASALGALFCPANHLNSLGAPASGYQTEAGGTQVKCDGSNINPVALAILNTKLANGQFAIPNPQITLPNSGNDPTDQFQQGQSTFSLPAHYNEDQFLIDLDHNLSSRNALAGRFFYARSVTNLPLGTANVPGWATDANARNTMFVLADTHTFRANLVNVARIGLIRFDGLSSVESPLTAQSIGQSTPTGVVSSSSVAPAISIGGVTLGDGGTPNQFQVTNTFVYQDTVAYTRGRHNMAFGAEYKRHQVAEEQPQQASGNVFVDTWDDFLVGQSATQNGSPFGISNISGSVAGGGLFRRDERYTDFAAFAQDDIKLLQRLTINAGLRYEIFGAPMEIHGRLPNFIPSLAITGPLTSAGTFTGFTLPSNFAGMAPTGVVVNNFAGFYKTPHLDFEPRIGFALQLTSDKRTVLRGGYGIYFDQHSGNVAEQTISQLPFATLQFGFGAQAAAATLHNPFTPNVLPPSSYPQFQARTDSSSPFIEGTNPDIKDGRTDEYDVNIQRAVGTGYLIEIGYVGTQSSHRPGQVEFDQAALASPSHPINGETTNSIANTPNRVPIQGISLGSLYSDSVFIANYNALQASVTRRMTHGFQMQASYTWSKNLDEVANEGGTDLFELNLPTNNQLDLRHSSYGPAGDDRAHRFVVDFLYQTPRLASAPRLLREAVGRWSFSGIGVIQSGAALSIFDGNAGSVYGLLGGETRAQRATGNPVTTGSTFSRVVGAGRWLNASAFTRAPEAPNGTSLADQDFGNSGVGIVRGPGQHSLDLAAERAFPITERVAFRFRAEAFNLTNTPQFGNPNTSLGYGNAANPTPTASSSVGLISHEQGGPHPRVIQLAARITF